jgi:ATP/maltotriose-dependent transcriptional regulator MalT
VSVEPDWDLFPFDKANSRLLQLANVQSAPDHQTLHPAAWPELVSRPRLIERLNEGLHRELTLASALAGYDKTTLVSE